jgi:hypothetical protein
VNRSDQPGQPTAGPEHRRGPTPPDWYERSRAREPERRAARETELRQLGHPYHHAATIARTEAGQREWEREERAASRNPERYYGPGAPETRQTFRQRATDARTQISLTREQFAEIMRRSFPGWTPPGTPPPSPEAGREAEAGS